jgi:hypothetical protein
MSGEDRFLRAHRGPETVPWKSLSFALDPRGARISSSRPTWPSIFRASTGGATTRLQRFTLGRISSATSCRRGRARSSHYRDERWSRCGEVAESLARVDRRRERASRKRNPLAFWFHRRRSRARVRTAPRAGRELVNRQVQPSSGTTRALVLKASACGVRRRSAPLRSVRRSDQTGMPCQDHGQRIGLLSPLVGGASPSPHCSGASLTRPLLRPTRIILTRSLHLPRTAPPSDRGHCSPGMLTERSRVAFVQIASVPRLTRVTPQEDSCPMKAGPGPKSCSPSQRTAPTKGRPGLAKVRRRPRFLIPCDSR